MKKHTIEISSETWVAICDSVCIPYTSPDKVLESIEDLKSLVAAKKRPLTEEQVWELNDKYGYFDYGDAQGDKSRAFVKSVEALHGIFTETNRLV